MQDLRYFRNAYLEIGNFILNALNVIRIEDVAAFVDLLVNTYRSEKKVLVVGAGRSGLVGRAFAMRLMHLGFRSYVLGETITPSVGENDVVVAISGSGTTTMVVAAAEAAKKMKAKVVAITSYRDSPLASYADIVVQVPGRTKVAKMDDYFARQILGLHEPLAPLGTLFEDTAMVMLDAVIAELMYRLGKTEEDVKSRHANIEVL
ncbi:MAG: 6-phospho-3-hexuloisomerase [Vulcanisaeta sp.]|jgi:6-phospho-3-hexuloisomerase|nr:6-phospho-3-hexuloisomerase [Vulcanisaeta sp.]MCG2869189.1 6-phospho-3-hexuloisomerase [Vulcanisaeta sp.]MCG2880249.1 6-phospho-3-hexuloisomerase [Vulcanisaeta sp.]MCG2887282.1 6-phospho-3-hexuloisomerase [Vulcanisaeta sp.]MCG2895559.1 6-phospho-3-hexuloisomerase [Vulcanisaeta sp.]